MYKRISEQITGGNNTWIHGRRKTLDDTKEISKTNYGNGILI